MQSIIGKWSGTSLIKLQFRVVTFCKNRVRTICFRFIRFMRYCEQDDKIFMKTQCRAKMRRTTTYNIDISIDKYGNVLKTQCECVAGMGPFAHCKHIRSSFLPLLDHSVGKSMNLELTCTETIQTFHRNKYNEWFIATVAKYKLL